MDDPNMDRCCNYMPAAEIGEHSGRCWIVRVLLTSTHLSTHVTYVCAQASIYMSSCNGFLKVVYTVVAVWIPRHSAA
jgi:hypothetical protein